MPASCRDFIPTIKNRYHGLERDVDSPVLARAKPVDLWYRASVF